MADTVCKKCRAGTWSDVSGLGSRGGCKICKEGEYGSHPGRASPCQVCPEGRIATTQEAIECTACALGKRQKNEGNGRSDHDEYGDCKACPKGAFAHQWEINYCGICAAGKYGDAGGCYETTGRFPGLTLSTVGKFCCEDCPKGTYNDDGNSLFGTSPDEHAGIEKCAICSPGQYSKDIAATRCKNCRRGTFQSGGSKEDHDSDYDCKYCQGHTYSDESGSWECKKCPSGTTIKNRFSNPTLDDRDDVTDCKGCPTGYSFHEVKKKCTGCPHGKFGSGTQCLVCAAGLYNDENSKKHCKQCPVGMRAPDFGLTLCKECDAGRYMDEKKGVACKKCPPGKGSKDSSFTGAESETDACATCAAGKFNPEAGRVNCKKRAREVILGLFVCLFVCSFVHSFVCLFGWVGLVWFSLVQINNLNSRKSCPHTSPPEPRSSPSETITGTNCDVGFYLPQEQRGLPRCLLCRVANVSGSETCDGCAAGTAGVYPSCKNCTNGNYAEGGFTICIACPTGYHGLPFSRSRCIACPSGKWSSAAPGTANTSERGACTSCSPGYYGPSKPGQTSQEAGCLPCEAGRFNENFGSPNIFSCKLCQPGRWANDVARHSECNRCEGGTFSAVLGAQTPCTSCPEGFFQKNKSQASCDACNPGMHQRDQGQMSCSSCQRGTYAESTGASMCTRCNRGRYQPKPSQVTCLSCEAGRVGGSYGMLSCDACQRGRFQADRESNSTVCKQCPGGYHMDAQGQTFCMPCLPGLFADQAGQAVCLRCAKNAYSVEVNATRCIQCPAGFEAPAVGSAFCQVCDGGSFSSRGTPCKKCSTGRHKVASSSGTTSSCQDCELGRYQAQAGRAVCRACTPGQHQEQRGQTACVDCKKNEFSDDSGDGNLTFCRQCPSGFDTKDTSGLSFCYVCGAGQFADAPGKTCSRCPRGRFAAEDAIDRSFCVPCTHGKFQNSFGKTSCRKCSVGQFSNTTGAVQCEQCPTGWMQSKAGSIFCERPAVGAIIIDDGASSVQVSPGWMKADCFTSEDETRVCAEIKQCPQGTYGTKSAEGCILCAPGRTSGAGAYREKGQEEDPCFECQVGLYAPQDGSPKCLRCLDMGQRRYSDEKGAVRVLLWSIFLHLFFSS